ncbi:hypothetical protein [Acinetobacter bereziniae]|uniref:Sporulation protein Cse60 n=1 Tax=Acinetobacter bereziniae NIPH 3 TaxID=1217651 RepID=N8YN37_ACIBZ|nr:hypothetical protein [Acinetobacter bereziniae]ENV20978.1 hypothetical protein F963_03109 [Acinetobacter bereziniae NIPH 3]
MTVKSFESNSAEGLADEINAWVKHELVKNNNHISIKAISHTTCNADDNLFEYSALIIFEYE